MGQSSAIEAVLRRDRLVVVAGLVIVASTAWGWTLAGVGMPMDHGSSMAVRETMGYFAGIVPLRGTVDPARTFSDALRAVHQNTVDCFASAMPFVMTVTTCSGEAERRRS